MASLKRKSVKVDFEKILCLKNLQSYMGLQRVICNASNLQITRPHLRGVSGSQPLAVIPCLMPSPLLFLHLRATTTL